jgi:serine/threonine-protein kinase
MTNERIAFGKYHVLARLGHGGMGKVYLAMHTGPAGILKLLVVKQLREDLVASHEARSMFLDEARISTRLNHPNIVQTNEVVDEGDDLYLVMEFLDGQPLGRILHRQFADAFPLSTKLRILIEALEGLHYAHELRDYDGTPLNVVHRDVSPHNIIVTYEGHVKLVDFGIAKAADATTVTESGVFKGKVRYASPEQALCQEVDRRADVFSMGTILWETIGQRRMWPQQGDAQVLVALASGKIPSVRDARPEVPAELEAICAKALAPDPAQRYATALQFRDALVRYLRNAPDETDLGAAVSATFANERREIRTLIESQAKVIREASSGKMRAIPVIAMETSGSAPSKKSSPGTLGPTDLAWRLTGGFRSLKPTSRIAAVTALIGVVGAVVLIASSRRTVASPAPGASATVDTLVHLSVHATPPSAHVAVDGTPLPSNPYEGDAARDGATHRVIVSADGFESRELEVRFSRDVSLDVALVPRPPVLPPAPSPSPAARPAPVRAWIPPSSPPRHPSQRSIDEEDPYSQ